MNIIINQMINILLFLDFPRRFQMSFQDSATPVMSGIVDLHSYISFFLILILIFVAFQIFDVLTFFRIDRNYKVTKRLFYFFNKRLMFLNLLNQKFSHLFQYMSLKSKIYKFNHQTTLETIWTILPVFFIFLFGIPSFVLLYSNDVPVDSSVTLKAIGKQWFWNYQLQFPVLNDMGFLDYKLNNFDSYMLNFSDLITGQLRNLEVDYPVRLPVKTHLDIIVTADDVLHSFALPSLGIKIDAVPGRLNHTGAFIERPGIFYGQCSELCGTNHAFMPIELFAVPYDLFSLTVN